jgi:GPH family glycoside/pentoside/hexuronide:cation symporter
MMTVAVYLPNYYTDQLGVSAAMLSWVFLCGRCWDAVTDPTMGHVSDHTRTRWGRRRPYFLLSALPIWLLYYFIWSPSPSLSSTGIFIHLLVTYIALFTFWTMFNIPYYSLGMELTPDYHERNRLFGGRQIFGIIGTIVGVVSPLLFTKLTGSKVAGYPWMGIVIGGMGAMFMMTTFFSVKERQETVALPTFPFFKGLGVTFRNRAFVILMLTYLATLIGSSFIAPLAMYMAKYVVKREWVVQPLILSYMTCSLLSIPLWLFISKRIGKIKTWTAAMLLSMTGYALTYAVNEGGWLLWIICTIPTGAAAGCSMVLGPSIQADVIDSDELETGTRREGAFIGVWSFIDKAAIGVAVFLGLQGLDLIGFKPNVEQTVMVTNGIKILISFLPTALTLVAVILFQMFPITQEVHAEIRAQLEARKNGTAVDENT